MVFLKVVLVGLASPRGLTVRCFPQEYFSPTPPFHFRCVGPCGARALRPVSYTHLTLPTKA